MADRTPIEWTDATVNAINGCTLVDEGCRNCYAAQLAATRMKSHPTREGLARINAEGVAKFTGEVRLNEAALEMPLRWRKPRRIFWNAHGDTFHEAVPDEWIDRMMAVIALTPQHVHQVLTKRPERAREYFAGFEEGGRFHEGFRDALIEGAAQSHYHQRTGEDPSFWLAVNLPLPNLWLGTSVSDQESADARIPALLDTPAAVRFLSAEPLLGPVNLRNILIPAIHGDPALALDALRGRLELALHPQEQSDTGSSLDWVIVGGESGRRARPMHPDWVRVLRYQCTASGVPFFFKQWGEWLPWEPISAPLWRNQRWEEEDGNILFPANMDDDPRWDDGLFESMGLGHAVFQRVGKAAAGRWLDGSTWDEVPAHA